MSFQAYKRARDETEQQPNSTETSALSASELLLHSSTHPKLDYIAREEQSTGADSLLKHYIGVFDPKTGDLQLVEARKLVVRGVLRSVATQTTPNGVVDKQPTVRPSLIHLLFPMHSTNKFPYRISPPAPSLVKPSALKNPKKLSVPSRKTPSPLFPNLPNLALSIL